MEYELVNVRLHPHPLLFHSKEHCSNNNGAVCCRCRLPLSFTPGFVCSESDCDYQIHESCIHLPPQINTSFHPQHPLFLGYSYDHCQACGQKPPSNEMYRCCECNFEIEIKCAIADSKLSKTSNGKYVYIGHQQHPLTLLIGQQNVGGENKKTVYYCVVCKLAIQSSSSTYFCSICDDRGYFHKECAELPIEVQIPDHPHPLYLQKGKDYEVACHRCRNVAKGFMYSCYGCKFILHISCFLSLNHTHNFTRLRHKMKFTCGVCGENSNSNRFVLLCEICHILVHEECAEFPLTLRIYEHPHHDLTYINYFSRNYYDDDGIYYDTIKIHCMLCGDVINRLYGGYGCSKCNYFTHLKCTQGRSMELPSTLAEKENGIENFNSIHPHTLTLFSPKDISGGEYRVCDGCMKYLSNSDSSHGCARCDFYIHDECAKLPTKIISPIHPSHFLTLVSIHNFLFQCEACLQYFHGFAYHCKTCTFTFDTRCASIQTRFQHPNHQHPLYLKKGPGSDDDCPACDACGERTVANKHKFQCAKSYCKFNLDLRCATLPVIVRHRFDQHPLRLSFFEKERMGEYYCDICEEEREVKVWFYSCRKCNFEAQQRCVLGEFPFLKSAMHKSHKHPLNFVTVMKDQGDRSDCCRACNNKLYDRDFAFECGVCKFNVHATGPCYRLQVSEENLVFTNYNVFCRANQPYHHHSIENVMEFGPSCEGRAWNESVFSNITGFVIYHDYKQIWCIQIQYAKNGELVWSWRHGNEGGTRSEICFDYPEEYLVSIDGTGNNALTSLTIKSNRETYGTFGNVEYGESFSSVIEGVKIIGIFGTTDVETYDLASIGFQGISTTNE